MTSLQFTPETQVWPGRPSPYTTLTGLTFVTASLLVPRLDGRAFRGCTVQGPVRGPDTEWAGRKPPSLVVTVDLLHCKGPL